MQTAKQILHGYLRLYRSISEEYRGQFGTVTLTFPQTLVLSLLSAEGPMPISELAKATGSANSTISGVLDRLEQMELIQRIRSEKDRRVVYVALTPHYEDVREEIESSVLRKFPDLIGRMSPEEIEQIQTGLAVLEKALKHSYKKARTKIYECSMARADRDGNFTIPLKIRARDEKKILCRIREGEKVRSVQIFAGQQNKWNPAE